LADGQKGGEMRKERTKRQECRRRMKMESRKWHREIKETRNESRGKTRSLLLWIIAITLLSLGLIVLIKPAHAEMVKKSPYNYIVVP
jgi:hypothetical protein